MTFAHELQHVVQHSTMRKSWAACQLANALPSGVFRDMTSCQLPTEREALIVAKSTAEFFFGPDSVREHINSEIAQSMAAGDNRDARNWECVRQLDVSALYDLEAETKRFFRQHLRKERNSLHELLQDRGADPDFKDVNLDALFGDETP